MRVQHIVNMASAFIVLVGGMIILFYFSGNLSTGIQVAIGVFVTLYFLLRAGKSYQAIKSDARRSHSILGETMENDPDKKTEIKKPLT